MEMGLPTGKSWMCYECYQLVAWSLLMILIMFMLGMMETKLLAIDCTGNWIYIHQRETLRVKDV